MRQSGPERKACDLVMAMRAILQGCRASRRRLAPQLSETSFFCARSFASSEQQVCTVLLPKISRPIRLSLYQVRKHLLSFVTAPCGQPFLALRRASCHPSIPIVEGLSWLTIIVSRFIGTMQFHFWRSQVIGFDAQTDEQVSSSSS